MIQKRVTNTLEKVARLYDLVDEMRQVISELREVNVDVRIGNHHNINDPLGTHAAIMVTLRPGCERLENGS